MRRIVSKAEEDVLRWFGHMRRMNKNRIVGRVVRSEVKGGRGEGMTKVELDG